MLRFTRWSARLAPLIKSMPFPYRITCRIEVSLCRNIFQFAPVSVNGREDATECLISQPTPHQLRVFGIKDIVVNFPSVLLPNPRDRSAIRLPQRYFEVVEEVRPFVLRQIQPGRRRTLLHRFQDFRFFGKGPNRIVPAFARRADDQTLLSLADPNERVG